MVLIARGERTFAELTAGAGVLLSLQCFFFFSIMKVKSFNLCLALYKFLTRTRNWTLAKLAEKGLVGGQVWLRPQLARGDDVGVGDDGSGRRGAVWISLLLRWLLLWTESRRGEEWI